jgi:hypothetical protein
MPPARLPNNHRYRHAGALNDGFAVTDGRVDDDAIRGGHGHSDDSDLAGLVEFGKSQPLHVRFPAPATFQGSEANAEEFVSHGSSIRKLAWIKCDFRMKGVVYGGATAGVRCNRRSPQHTGQALPRTGMSY